MRTQSHTRTNAITLALALLGIGALASCSASGPAAPTAKASASQLKASAGTASASARATASPVPTTARAVERGMLNAVRSGHSVHTDVITVTSSGSVSASMDSTTNGGRQVFTIGKTGHLTILLIAGVGYVYGNSAALEAYLQVPQELAIQYADQWIAVRAGDKLGAARYSDIIAGITLSSVSSELEQNGPLTLRAPVTVGGQRVVGIQSPVAASAQLPSTARSVLYVTDNSLLRPVMSEVTGAGSYKYHLSFSGWGETVHLTAPANPVPASTITPASTTA